MNILCAACNKLKRSTHTGPISFGNLPLLDIWEYLKSHPHFGDIAEFRQGIRRNLPLEQNRDILISLEPKPGFKKGLNKVRGEIEPYYARHTVYLNMDKKYCRSKAHLFPWERPKVIANRAMISDGPWRIVSLPDRSGLVCRQNFIGIWPKTDLPIETISALINSPLVNAALYISEDMRLNRIVSLKQIPVPFPKTIDYEKITHLVKHYAELRSKFDKSSEKKPAIDECIRTITEVDGLVLKAYDLPPRLERKLLDFFRGYHRPFPFVFPDYYPENFVPCIPLHKYLEMDLKGASAGELLKRITPFDTADMHEFFMDLEARQS